MINIEFFTSFCSLTQRKGGVTLSSRLLFINVIFRSKCTQLVLYWRSFFLSNKIEWMVPVLRVSYFVDEFVLFLEYLPTVMKGFPCGFPHNNPSKLNSSKRTFRLTWYIRKFKQYILSEVYIIDSCKIWMLNG